MWRERPRVGDTYAGVCCFYALLLCCCCSCCCVGIYIRGGASASALRIAGVCTNDRIMYKKYNTTQKLTHLTYAKTTKREKYKRDTAPRHTKTHSRRQRRRGRRCWTRGCAPLSATVHTIGLPSAFSVAAQSRAKPRVLDRRCRRVFFFHNHHVIDVA